MNVFDIGRRRIFFLVAAVGFLVLLFNLFFLSSDDASTIASKLPIPGLPHATEAFQYPAVPTQTSSSAEEDDPATYAFTPEVKDAHPIRRLMQEADQRWRIYESERSVTFRQVVEKYRSKYGRHPPPGFKEWYKFARKRNVFNIDDFEQIMDDLRPFWAVPPQEIRQHAAHLWEKEGEGIAGVHVRNKKVAELTNKSWRSETFQQMVDKFVEHLPDMDIAINRLDQPRLAVPWEDLQKLLQKEYDTRALPPEASYSFTKKQHYILNTAYIKNPAEDNSTRLSGEWFSAPGQQYMKIAAPACPPESPARANLSIEETDRLYKDQLGGLVTNFNLSSDLCTAGPAIQNLHGMMYSASSILASKKLLPVFGECKVNINNDILFPANMYYRDDKRYLYSSEQDVDWEDKSENMTWRGVTSGGVQIKENWETMHRQRLVRELNGTYMALAGQTVNVLTQGLDPSNQGGENATYENFDRFHPAMLADEHTDVGFVESWGCVPDCSFYDDVFSWKSQIDLTAHFKSRYLIDVDGHSFSGRWRAFLQSKSLGFKATIFREWHDSRLFAWRHFVPVDNRYDDLYSLLTYFIGYGKPGSQRSQDDNYVNGDVYIPQHDFEGKKIARQGSEWANQVLRRDDIDVYMFRLLLEYGRIIDDNRDRIGYSGDGSELDKFDSGAEDGASHRWGIGKLFGTGKKPKPSDAVTGSRLGQEGPASQSISL